jgi:hypothetical protein
MSGFVDPKFAKADAINARPVSLPSPCQGEIQRSEQFFDKRPSGRYTARPAPAF